MKSEMKCNEIGERRKVKSVGGMKTGNGSTLSKTKNSDLIHHKYHSVDIEIGTQDRLHGKPSHCQELAGTAKTEI